MTATEKIQTIEKMYDQGASLDAIIRTVGADDETLRTIHARLGTAMSTLRRVASEISES